jgi:hypothetical protein
VNALPGSVWVALPDGHADLSINAALNSSVSALRKRQSVIGRLPSTPMIAVGCSAVGVQPTRRSILRIVLCGM